MLCAFYTQLLFVAGGMAFEVIQSFETSDPYNNLESTSMNVSCGDDHVAFMFSRFETESCCDFFTMVDRNEGASGDSIFGIRLLFDRYYNNFFRNVRGKRYKLYTDRRMADC